MNSNKDPDIKVREVTSPARLCVKDYGENRKKSCLLVENIFERVG